MGGGSEGEREREREREGEREIERLYENGDDKDKEEGRREERERERRRGTICHVMTYLVYLQFQSFLSSTFDKLNDQKSPPEHRTHISQ